MLKSTKIHCLYTSLTTNSTTAGFLCIWLVCYYQFSFVSFVRSSLWENQGLFSPLQPAFMLFYCNSASYIFFSTCISIKLSKVVVLVSRVNRLKNIFLYLFFLSIMRSTSRRTTAVSAALPPQPQLNKTYYYYTIWTTLL